jgi:hypothetical protein
MRVAITSAVLALAAVTSCASPAIDDAGYRGKVTHSAQAMIGIVGSAQLATELDLSGKMIASVTDNIVSQAEQDAQSVLTALDSRQPPDEASVQLKTHADQPLQDAADELTDLRVAVRRGDHAAERKSLSDLAKTLKDLQQLQAST